VSKLSDFCKDGFVIQEVAGIQELIKDCLDSLTRIASLGISEKFETFEELGMLLERQFNRDNEVYTGILKAFANTPYVQRFATLPGIVELARSLGILEPSLVTPPILHCVKDELILNREKVFTPAHQDVVSTKGTVGQLVFWVPLHSILQDNFGIQAWPGSHLKGQRPSTYSPFGHTVSSEEIPKSDPEYLNMKKGEVLVFSQYLIHQTFKHGTFRLAISFRFNDALDQQWADRKFFNAFQRVENNEQYADLRNVPPKDCNLYFESLNHNSR